MWHFYKANKCTCFFVVLFFKPHLGSYSQVQVKIWTCQEFLLKKKHSHSGANLQYVAVNGPMKIWSISIFYIIKRIMLPKFSVLMMFVYEGERAVMLSGDLHQHRFIRLTVWGWMDLFVLITRNFNSFSCLKHKLRPCFTVHGTIFL